MGKQLEPFALLGPAASEPRSSHSQDKSKVQSTRGLLSG